MRKLLILFVLLLSGLLLTQSGIAASAGYGDCCAGQGCKSMPQCASLACAACIASVAVDTTASAAHPQTSAIAPQPGDDRLPPDALHEIWSPPD